MYKIPQLEADSQTATMGTEMTRLVLETIESGN